MKRTFIVLVLVLTALACDRSKDVLTPDSTTLLPAALSKERAKFSLYVAPDLGDFVYRHLNNHILNEDPYNYLPQENRAEFKVLMDEAKRLMAGDSWNHDVLWEYAYQKGKLKTTLRAELNELSGRLRKFSALYSGKEFVSRWFDSEKARIAGRSNLDYDDKRFLIRHLTVLESGTKSLVDSFSPLNYSEGTRLSVTQTGCAIQMIDCYLSTTGAYAGIGALFSSTTGAIVGGAVGVLVSIATCNCSGATCRYPTYISTPDICYNSANGINFYVAGLSSGTERIVWDVYNSTNTIAANHILQVETEDNRLYMTNAQLQGNSNIYIRATAQCIDQNGAHDLSSALTGFNVTVLGLPFLTVDGPTNVQANPSSSVWYSLTGRNLTNLNWTIYTFGVGSGQIMSSGSTGAWIRWLSAGYLRPSASATTPCGTSSSGPYVQVYN